MAKSRALACGLLTLCFVAGGLEVAAGREFAAPAKVHWITSTMDDIPCGLTKVTVTARGDVLEYGEESLERVDLLGQKQESARHASYRV